MFIRFFNWIGDWQSTLKPSNRALMSIVYILHDFKLARDNYILTIVFIYID